MELHFNPTACFTCNLPLKIDFSWTLRILSNLYSAVERHATRSCELDMLEEVGRVRADVVPEHRVLVSLGWWSKNRVDTPSSSEVKPEIFKRCVFRSRGSMLKRNGRPLRSFFFFKTTQTVTRRSSTRKVVFLPVRQTCRKRTSSSLKSISTNWKSFTRARSWDQYTCLGKISKRCGTNTRGALTVVLSPEAFIRLFEVCQLFCMCWKPEALKAGIIDGWSRYIVYCLIFTTREDCDPDSDELEALTMENRSYMGFPDSATQSQQETFFQALWPGTKRSNMASESEEASSKRQCISVHDPGETLAQKLTDDVNNLTNTIQAHTHNSRTT